MVQSSVAVCWSAAELPPKELCVESLHCPLTLRPVHNQRDVHLCKTGRSVWQAAQDKSRQQLAGAATCIVTFRVVLRLGVHLAD
jgi:hypothetical protein